MSTTGLPTPDELEKQIDAYTAALQAYRDPALIDPAAQTKTLQRLRQAAQRLERAVSTPAQQFSIIRNGGQQSAVLRLAIAIDLFAHVSTNKALTITQLAQLTNTTPELVHRIARALAAQDFLIESRATTTTTPSTLYDTLTYTSTPLGAFVSASPAAQAGHAYIFDVQVAALCSMSDYLATFGRQSPADPLNCPAVFAQGAKDIDYFAQMAKRPDRAQAFGRLMEGMNEASFVEMAGCFDFGRLEAPGGGEGPVLVDVGGGDGRMVRRLRERFPGMRGRVVVQDLPEVVRKGTVVEGWEGVEVMGYDFFQGVQPVKGAAAYFHQHILHDWPTDACRTILRNLRPAMPPTSRLLLSEMIVSDHNPEPARCIADISIMVVGGMERSESQWRELLQSEGFRAVEFYGVGNVINGVIEAVRDETWWK